MVVHVVVISIAGYITQHYGLRKDTSFMDPAWIQLDYSNLSLKFHPCKFIGAHSTSLCHPIADRKQWQLQSLHTRAKENYWQIQI